MTTLTVPVARALAIGAAAGAFVLFPSLGIVQKVAGTRAALVYGLAGCVAATAASRYGQSVFARLDAIGDRRLRQAGGVCALALLLAFALLYPVANRGGSMLPSLPYVSGGGSDRDDALTVGGEALLAGQYPYYGSTYLGNPISPMPGSLVAALPFAWMGNAAVQNLLWLPVFVVVVRLVSRRSVALATAIGLFVLCPGVTHDFITGGDLVANSVMVLAAALWLMSEGEQGRTGWRFAVAAAALGVALSSRATFWLAMPAVAARMWRACGLSRSLHAVTMVGLAWAALTLPFYAYDPAAFTPLTAQNRFVVFDRPFPRLAAVAPFVCLAWSLILPVAVDVRRLPACLMAGGAAMLAPAVIMVVLASRRDALLNFYFSTYGLPATIVGGLGLVLAMHGRSRSG